MKKNSLWCVGLMALLAAGCAATKTTAPTAPPQSTAIVTPDVSLVAKVVSVNPVGRFVVLNFPSGQLPKFQTAMFLYRGGLKVAEIRITGPQDGNNTVGDLVSGEAAAGDSVRDQ